MAAHSILFTSPTTISNSLIFPISNPNSTSLSLQSSSFHGVSLKSTINRQTLTVSVAPKHLTFVAAFKKAVAVLKGTSTVEGVVTLTQEDNGVVEATIFDKQIPLTGPNAVVGRAFVVHELADDLEKGGHELSLSNVFCRYR